MGGNEDLVSASVLFHFSFFLSRHQSCLFVFFFSISHAFFSLLLFTFPSPILDLSPHILPFPLGESSPQLFLCLYYFISSSCWCLLVSSIISRSCKAGQFIFICSIHNLPFCLNVFCSARNPLSMEVCSVQ